MKCIFIIYKRGTLYYKRWKHKTNTLRKKHSRSNLSCFYIAIYNPYLTKRDYTKKIITCLESFFFIFYYEPVIYVIYKPVIFFKKGFYRYFVKHIFILLKKILFFIFYDLFWLWFRLYNSFLKDFWSNCTQYYVIVKQIYITVFTYNDFKI